MGLLDDLYGMNEPIGDYEFRNGSTGLTAARKPKGVIGLLDDISKGSDATLSKIPDIDRMLEESGAHQSPIGHALGRLLAAVAPSVIGSAARIAKAPYDYATGRDNDLRLEDAALAFPAAGAAGRAVAPLLRMTPEAATMAGMGGAGFAYGHGVASEANAADADSRVTMPNRLDKQKFLEEFSRYSPRPMQPGDLAGALSEAEKAASSVKGFEDLGPKAQQRRIQEARQRAELAYNAQGANLRTQQDQWEKAAERAWQDAQTGWDKQERDFKNQGFWDRNPEIKPYAMGAAYALPALFGAGSAIQKSRTAQRLAEDMTSADLGKAAAAKVASDKMLSPSIGDQAKKVGLTALAAGGPFELRSIGDAIDATFAPEGSGAQQRAREHFSNPLTYLASGVPQMLSGAMLYGMGNKAGSLATRDPKVALAGVTSPNLTEEINAIAAQRRAVGQAGFEAEKQGLANRGLLSDLETDNAVKAVNNRARVAQASQDAATLQQNSGLTSQARDLRTGLAGRGLMPEAAEAAPSAIAASPQSPRPAGLVPAPEPQAPPAPRPLPPPLPDRNIPALPPSKEPREWSRIWSEPARKSVEEYITKNPGVSLSALDAPALVRAITTRLPAGSPLPSPATARAYLKALREAVPDKPTVTGLQRQWRADPSGLLFGVGAPLAGLGLMNFGDDR